MECSICNSLVLWDNPVIGGNSTCQNCGKNNSQKVENFEDENGMLIDIRDCENFVIGDARLEDYPEFCDAYIESAQWIENGKELTDEELQYLTENYPDIVSELAFVSFL